MNQSMAQLSEGAGMYASHHSKWQSQVVLRKRAPRHARRVVGLDRGAAPKLIALGAIFLLTYSCSLAEQGPVTLPNYHSGQSPPHTSHRISVRPLDLSRTPTTDELMAAGQLGGVLYPTHELQDKRREAAGRLDFGKAIEEWNKHEYPKAIQHFKGHLAKFPDSPWAAESILHVGCDATYNGRYTEAETIFTQMIAANRGTNHPGAQMMLSKARQRLALVKVEQNNLEEATNLFLDLKNESPDWKLRTYAVHWLQRLSTYIAAREALLNCGADSLAYIFEKEGNPGAAKRVRSKLPQTMRGHSIRALVELAADQGYDMAALRLSMSDLDKLPLPAVLHIKEGSAGDKGHYWVLDKIQGRQVELFDPQSTRRFHQTVEELAIQWSGNALVFSKTERLPGRKLDASEMEDAIGGCCGAPAAPSNQGNPDRNAAARSDNNNSSSCGAPIWSVNILNLNLYVTDTPMWYDPPIGPPVHISLSYSSQSSIAHHEPFGNKWTFSYGGYLIMDTSGTVTIFMPDGRMDVYTPNGAGGFNRPYRVFNTLSLIGPNHYELKFPDGTVYVYQLPPGTSSQQPFLTEVRDAYGQKLTLGYNTNVDLTTITDAQGKVFSLSYNPSSLVTNVTDPFGRNAVFQYDPNNNLVQITDMGGYSSTLTYDTNVFVTTIGDATGTTHFYTEVPGPAGNNSDNYPPPGDLNMFRNYRITVTNPLGGNEEFMWYAGCDQDGFGCAGYSWYISARDYIPWQSQAVNSYRSRAPKTRYFPIGIGSGQRGEIAKVLYPEGDYVQYGYDDVTGDRTSVTDSHGHTWNYTYNPMSRVTSITDAKGTPTFLTYATNDVDLLSVSNGLGRVLLSYNAQHDLLSFTDFLTNNTSTSYNSYGQITSMVDALNITNDYLYDANKQLSGYLRNGQTLAVLNFDANNRLLTYTGPSGFTVSNTYNNLNQKIRATYIDGRFETYAYSTCCPRLLDSVTDRASRTTYFTHDAMKRLTQIQNPEGGLVQYSYDANGNRTQLLDPNGNATSFAFDLDNRLTNKSYADGKGFSLIYDQGGLITNRINARGIATSYAYDFNHNLMTTMYSDDTPAVTNTYDAFNRKTIVKDGVGTNIYVYDANSRLMSFDGPWENDTVTYAFDPIGRMTNLVAEGGSPTAYFYDPLNRLAGVQVGAAAFAYTYAGSNPLVQRLDRPNGSYTTYQYDMLNRLTDIANRQSTGQIINEFSYTYNGQDMRDSETVSNGYPITLTTNQLVAYDYNRLNQVLASSPLFQVFFFDSDGNMTQGHTPDGHIFTGAYDAENRLKHIAYTNDSGVVFSSQYLYFSTDFLARTKEYQNGLLTNETRYVRSSYFPLQERNSNNTVAQEYFWDPTKAGGIGGLLHLIQNAQQYSYTYDGKGNVAALLDSSQSPIISYAYSPLGDLVLTYGNFKQPFTLSTKSYSPETGLSYFGFRFYSAELGQWLNRDPIGERGGINLYNFVGNNPVMRRDPFGLDTAMPVDGSDCPNYENQGRAEENRQVPQEYDQYGEQGDNDYYDGWVKTYEKEQARAADQATQATVAGMGPIVMDFAFGEEVAFLWGLYSFQQAALNGDLPGVGWGVGGILLPGRWGKTVTAVGDVWNLITVQSQQFGGTR